MQQDFLKTNQRTAPVAKTPIKLEADELLAVITAFSNLLGKETSSLKRADFNAVDNLQNDKKLLAKQYDAKVRALSARRDEVINLDLTTREKLRSERLRFNTVLDDNMHALTLAKNSTKRMVNHILNTARAAVAEESKVNYSKAGKTTTYKSASTSLSIDTTL